MYEVVGGWVASTPEVGAKLMLDRHSRHHAWRARQWWERLPVVADVDREELLQAAADGLWGRPLLAAAGMETTVGRLAAAYRVLLPRMSVALALHKEAADAVSDGSSLRTIGIVGPDVAADWAEGEALLQGLLVGEDQVGAAAKAARAVEVLFAT